MRKKGEKGRDGGLGKEGEEQCLNWASAQFRPEYCFESVPPLSKE